MCVMGGGIRVRESEKRDLVFVDGRVKAGGNLLLPGQIEVFWKVRGERGRVNHSGFGGIWLVGVGF